MDAQDNRVAIITGASGGIGLACVRAFVEAGYLVAMSDIDPAGSELAASFGPERCRFYSADLTSEDDVRGLIERTVADFGRLNVLFNSAGLGQPDKPVHETTREEFDRIVAINLRGTFLASKYSYPHLRATRGSILNMSFMAGVHGENITLPTPQPRAASTRSRWRWRSITDARAFGVTPFALQACSRREVDALIAAQPNATKIIELRKNINLLGYTSTAEEIAGICVFLAREATSTAA